MPASRVTDNACPNCAESLPAESINIAEGVAHCPSCGRLSRLSEVASRRRPLKDLLQKPPVGCAVSETGNEIVVYATLRSLVGFFGAAFVTLFWNGITSIFVIIAAVNLYTHAVGPVPEWFPAPQMDEPMTLGMTLFLLLFMIPFEVIGAYVAVGTLLIAFGKVEVSLGENESYVRTSIGPIGWRRSFDAATVQSVTQGKSKWSSSDNEQLCVVIESNPALRFGSLLQEDRREWMQTVLHALLTEPEPANRRKILALAQR